MTTLPPLPDGFELEALTAEERFLQIERELGLAPTAEDPLAQHTLLNRVTRLERRLAALSDHLILKNS